MLVHGPYPIGEERVLREARAAAAAGYRVTIVAIRQPQEPWVEHIDGCTVVRMPSLARARSGAVTVAFEYLGFFTLATLAMIASLARPYDVVQVHNPPDFLLAAALPTRLRGTKLVLDVHDFAPELFELYFTRMPKAMISLLRRVERWAFRRADLVLTVNESYRSTIAAKRDTQRRVAVVLNSLDEGLLPSASPARGAADAFRVVTHGTLNHHYGVEGLVEAFGRLRMLVPRARLEIYGAGNAVPAIRRKIEDLAIGPFVSLTDRYLPQREVLGLISGADVGVVANLGLPRNHAALPVKLLEYVAMGIPVITSDLRAIHDYFDDSEIKFVDPGNVEALGDALIEAASAPDAAHQRAERAAARYQAYRWSDQAATYLRLLSELLDGDESALSQQTPVPGAPT